MRLLEPFGDATLTLPMLNLIGALENLEDGLRPPLLKLGKPPKGGRPGRSLADVRMATGSALVTVLHDTGRPVSEAEAYVARHMKIGTGSLRSWRKEVTSNRKNRDAVKFYKAVLSVCRKYGGEHAVEQILKNQFWKRFSSEPPFVTNRERDENCWQSLTETCHVTFSVRTAASKPLPICSKSMGSGGLQLPLLS